MASSSWIALRPAYRRIAFLSHLRPKSTSSRPMTKRSACSGMKRTMAVPKMATSTASTAAAAAVPTQALRQLIVTPTTSTMVKASTNSTVEARKAAIKTAHSCPVTDASLTADAAFPLGEPPGVAFVSRSGHTSRIVPSLCTPCVWMCASRGKGKRTPDGRGRQRPYIRAAGGGRAGCRFCREPHPRPLSREERGGRGGCRFCRNAESYHGAYQGCGGAQRKGGELPILPEFYIFDRGGRPPDAPTTCGESTAVADSAVI